MVMPKRNPDDVFGPIPKRPDFGLKIGQDALVEMLQKDNESLKKAGSELAAAALRVVSDYDGLHRLMLATAKWAEAIANEGGRGERHNPPKA